MNKSKINLLFAFTILLISFSFINTFHSCGHEYLKNKKSEMKTKTKSPRKINAEYDKRNDWQSIRIHTDFSGLISKNPNTHDLSNRIKTKVIPRVVKILGELVKVRRIKKITLNQEKCSDFKIPLDSYGPNNPKETDLIIFVNYDQSG